MREHHYAITKDLSKFYNCVLADPVAQHTLRVIWRDGDLEAAPKVYCTTTVNFGDKPAGCLAIAAIKETADLFGGDGKAAYFLKNRTYVDDCVAGSNSKSELEKISKELEEIVAKGGFKFKKTHMTGDLIKDGEPIKVLGLIWNTEKDEFQVDVKVNFSGKRGGVHTAPNVDLDEYLADKDLQQTLNSHQAGGLVHSAVAIQPAWAASPLHCEGQNCNERAVFQGGGSQKGVG